MTSTNKVPMRSLALAVSACAVLAMPVLAGATDDYRAVEQRLIGRVISFEPWHLQLDRGPRIVLHRGTVIHPTGLTLQNGMSVRVFGHVASDGAFSADEIDVMPSPPAAWGWHPN
jgi:hypothetical protein